MKKVRDGIMGMLAEILFAGGLIMAGLFLSFLGGR